MKYQTMDKNPVIRHAEFRRLNSEHDFSNGIVNICDLPREILEHILSFLPMKDAIKTSVLSRKWQYLWTSIPKLIFKRSSYSNRELFMNSVERVLLLHDRSSIKKFKLQCDVLYSASRINAWISTVARCNVEKCTIRLHSFRETVVLPHALFTCETLTKLYIAMSTVIPPSQINLPNLKTLHLYDVIFLNDCSTQQLLSSPALEDLFIDNCSFSNLKAICIAAPKLKILTILEKDLYTPDECCHVKICECNLEYFYYEGSLYNEYSISDLSVVEAVILAPEDTVFQPEVVHRLYKTMHGMRTAQDLKLWGMTIRVLEAGARFNFQGPLPIFKFLSSLELLYFDVKSGVLGKILESTPHLQTLKLAEGVGRSSYKEEDGEIFDPIPPCFFSSLKKIIIDVVYLDAGELYVLKTMLKHTRVLDRFVILPQTSIVKDDKEWVDFCRELVECPRGSKKCKIIF